MQAAGEFVARGISMKWGRMGGVFLAVWWCLGAGVRADGGGAERAIVEKVVAVWKNRLGTIKTIKGEARIDSFYSKVYLSDEHGEWDEGPLPPKDTVFRDELSSWAFDVVNHRFRIEEDQTEPLMASNLTDTSGNRIPPRFKKQYLLKLVDGMRLTFVQRPNKAVYMEFGNRVVSPHVRIRQRGGHEFFLTPIEWPLLWCLGHINADWPMPLKVPRLEAPEKFWLHGRGVFNGKNCLILRIANQGSKNSAREFWVGDEPDFPIYCCRVVDAGGAVKYQVGPIDYRRFDGVLAPYQWEYTSYHHDRNGRITSVRKKTATVAYWEFNVPLPQELFEQPLSPGMLVKDTDQDAYYVVAKDGTLVSWNPDTTWPEELVSDSVLARYVYVVAFVGVTVVALLCGYWYSKRRKK